MQPAVNLRFVYRAPGTALASCLLGLLLCVSSASAQFNPEGRRKSKPAPTESRTRRAPAAADSERREPSADALIRRYRAVVLAQPSAAFPLQRLAELYRERDGSVDALLADFEQRASTPGDEQYAASVALGGLYAQANSTEKAVAAYERALSLRPDAHEAYLAIARVHERGGEREKAYAALERALPRVDSPATREQVHRSLMQLAIELERYEAADRHHAELVDATNGSAFVQGELGRELLQRGKAKRAVAAFESAAKAATGDHRALAPALKELGAAQLAAQEFDAAVKSLERSRRLAGSSPGLQRELLELLADAHRGMGKLESFVTELEKRGQRDSLALEQLGGLYEEVGRLDDALEAYREALALRPGDIDTRIKVIRLLQLRGDLDQAIDHIKALIRSVPTNPQYVFQLAEALLARGDRASAIAELRKLEARAGDSEDTLTGLVDFYERVDENARALALLRRLTQLGSGDPEHFVDLGNRYWRDGERTKARQSWQRLREASASPAAGHQRLGEVYLEHDLTEEALEAFRQAVALAPSDPRYRQSLALALERIAPLVASTKRKREYREEAQRIWHELLAQSRGNPSMARDARRHLVSAWHIEGSLPERVAPLQRRLKGPPPDPEAGRLLAEVWSKLREPARAAEALERVVALAPGDTESLTRLERAYADQGKLRSALGILERLTAAEPARASEYYRRMAETAARLYDDELALRYARRVIALNPDDSAGHESLAALYLQTQRYEEAILAYRRAILGNPRSYPTYIDLADLLIARERDEEAVKLLERVILSSPDDELVARAARTSLRIHVGRNDIESLERVLLPQTLAHPGRTVFRRLLIELYGAQLMPWVQVVRYGEPSERREAQRALQDLGQRATKPLLDALSDAQEGQRRIAFQLLRYVQSPSAGPALIAFAQTTPDGALRGAAMRAVASMRSAALLPRIESILFPEGALAPDDYDPLVAGAGRAAALLGDRRAAPLLMRMLSSDSALMRAWGAIGLGILRAPAAEARLRDAAVDTSLGPVPRSAAAFALGQLGGGARLDEFLGSLAKDDEALVRAQATWSLARTDSSRAADAVATLLLSDSDLLVSAGVAAAIEFGRAQPQPAAEYAEELLEFEGSLSEWLARFPDHREVSAEAALAALEKLAPALRTAARSAAQRSVHDAISVAHVLVGPSGEAAFVPLTSAIGKQSTEAARSAAELVEGIGRGAADVFEQLAAHPAPSVRLEAIRFMASRKTTTAVEVLAAALDDADLDVQRAALDGIQRQPLSSELTAGVLRLLRSSDRWALRARAAEVLGLIPGAVEHDEVVAALVERLRGDDIAWVRQAAARALVAARQPAALRALARQAQRDPEPRVRANIEALLRSAP